MQKGILTNANGESTIKLQVPATVANLVCGFDILGMAVEAPFDIMEITLKQTKGITISYSGDFPLSVNPLENVAGVALQALLDVRKCEMGFHIHIDKKIKPGSGLGSSAASSAGAVVGANYLLGNPFSNDELIAFAMHGEKLAGGVKHADNVTPCIYGGITLIRSILPLDIVTIDYPNLFVTIVHPQIEVKTSDARQILRKEILLKDAIKQWGNIAGLVSGFIKHDYPLISRSLEDVIIEPVRSILIPGFEDVKKLSIKAGALGGGISGSGPSMFMFSKEQSIANAIEAIMQQIYRKLGVESKTYVTTINKNGIKIIT